MGIDLDWLTQLISEHERLLKDWIELVRSCWRSDPIKHCKVSVRRASPTDHSPTHPQTMWALCDCQVIGTLVVHCYVFKEYSPGFGSGLSGWPWAATEGLGQPRHKKRSLHSIWLVACLKSKQNMAISPTQMIWVSLNPAHRHHLGLISPKCIILRP